MGRIIRKIIVSVFAFFCIVALTGCPNQASNLPILTVTTNNPSLTTFAANLGNTDSITYNLILNDASHLN